MADVKLLGVPVEASAFVHLQEYERRKAGVETPFMAVLDLESRIPAALWVWGASHEELLGAITHQLQQGTVVRVRVGFAAWEEWRSLYGPREPSAGSERDAPKALVKAARDVASAHEAEAGRHLERVWLLEDVEALEKERDGLLRTLSAIGAWTRQYGAALVPSGEYRDSFGDGVRSAKRQVANLVALNPAELATEADVEAVQKERDALQARLDALVEAVEVLFALLRDRLWLEGPAPTIHDFDSSGDLDRTLAVRAAFQAAVEALAAAKGGAR